MAISFVGSATGSSSPNATPSLTLPGSMQTNDLIIVACMVADTANNGLAAPTEGGYTRVPGHAATIYSNDINDCNLDTFYKLHNGSDTTITCTAVGGTNASNILVCMVFRGVDTTTPFDVNAVTFSSQSSASINPASIDHNNPAGVWTVIAIAQGHTGGATATWTFPSGYTTNAAQRAHDDTIDGLLGMGYNSAPSDPEDPASATASNIGTAADNASASVTMALRPAAVTTSDAVPRLFKAHTAMFDYDPWGTGWL